MNTGEMAADATHARSIAEAFAACVGRFKDFLLVLAREQTPDDESQYLSPSDVFDEFGNLRIWGERTGASRPYPEQDSLDQSLREDEQLRSAVIGILNFLKEGLDEAISLVQNHARSVSIEEDVKDPGQRRLRTSWVLPRISERIRSLYHLSNVLQSARARNAPSPWANDDEEARYAAPTHRGSLNSQVQQPVPHARQLGRLATRSEERKVGARNDFTDPTVELGTAEIKKFSRLGLSNSPDSGHNIAAKGKAPMTARSVPTDDYDDDAVTLAPLTYNNKLPVLEEQPNENDEFRSSTDDDEGPEDGVSRISGEPDDFSGSGNVSSAPDFEEAKGTETEEQSESGDSFGAVMQVYSNERPGGQISQHRRGESKKTSSRTNSIDFVPVPEMIPASDNANHKTNMFGRFATALVPGKHANNQTEEHETAFAGSIALRRFSSISAEYSGAPTPWPTPSVLSVSSNMASVSSNDTASVSDRSYHAQWAHNPHTLREDLEGYESNFEPSPPVRTAGVSPSNPATTQYPSPASEPSSYQSRDRRESAPGQLAATSATVQNFQLTAWLDSLPEDADGQTMKRAARTIWFGPAWISTMTPDVFMQTVWSSASQVPNPLSPIAKRRNSTSWVLAQQYLPQTVQQDSELRLLEHYVSLGKVSAVRALLQCGCNCGTVRNPRPEPLVHAIKGTSLQHNLCVNALLSHNAAVNFRYRDKTPLHMALENRSFHGYSDLIRLLLEAGADPNARDNVGNHPLLKLLNDPRSATDHNHLEALAFFLRPRAGTDIHVREPLTQNTTLHVAVQRLAPAAVAMLIHAGVDLNAMNAHGITPLCMAVKAWQPAMLAHHIAILSSLLHQRRTIAVDAMVEPSGTTALYEAAVAANAAAVHMLLDAGAKPNLACGGSWRTPLQAAAVFGHEQVVECLLHYGADPNMNTSATYGTALRAASALRHEHVVTVLLRYGATPER